MSREIIWLPDAVEDLIRLRKFIQDKNPSAAQRAANKIKEVTDVLMTNPELGRPVDGLSEFRKILMPFGTGNYVFRYRKNSQENMKVVVVVRIWHTKEERL